MMTDGKKAAGNGDRQAPGEVYIQGLVVEAVIGAFDWEREVRQQLRLDVRMRCEHWRAAQTDQLPDALDYKQVAKRLVTVASAGRYRLLEALAERLASTVLQEFPATWVRLKVEKPGAVRGAAAVGVIVERSRRAS